LPGHPKPTPNRPPNILLNDRVREKPESGEKSWNRRPGDLDQNLGHIIAEKPTSGIIPTDRHLHNRQPCDAVPVQPGSANQTVS
jgi:hypothetical protein